MADLRNPKPEGKTLKNVLTPNAVRERLERVPRLLLVRLRSLGDSILALPLVEALHRWRPDLQLDVLIENPFAAVFSRHPAIHERLILKSRGPDAATGWSRLRMVAEIRRRHYGAVMNLHGGTTSHLFVLASGAGLRIGQESHRRSWIYNARIPPSSLIWNRDGLHTVEHQLTIMRWLELPVPGELRCRLYPDDESRARVLERLRQAGISRDRYFMIQPTATLFTKQWSAENFALLGDYLARRYALSVIFTSAPREAQVLLDIGKSASERHHYWSDLNLEDLFALIEGCRLFVGNDSGPTHAAAALQKPVVVVWGSSNYRAWHPWGTDYELVRSEFPCIPCPGYTCAIYGAPKCILEVPASRVTESCDRILARTAVRPETGRGQLADHGRT